MDRCNLTVLTLPQLCRPAGVPRRARRRGRGLAAVLPRRRRPIAQRGEGVFERSHRGAAAAERARLRPRHGSGLVLNLVTNPVGAFLPRARRRSSATGSASSKRRTASSSTGCSRSPTCRSAAILEWLERLGQPRGLHGAAGAAPSTRRGARRDVPRHASRSGWDGALYDCDFNQMLDLPVDRRGPQTITDLLRALTCCRTPWSPARIASAARPAPGPVAADRPRPNSRPQALQASGQGHARQAKTQDPRPQDPRLSPKPRTQVWPPNCYPPTGAAPLASLSLHFS